MVQLKCDCKERCDAKINSYKAFIELKEFFEDQEKQKVFSDVKVNAPFYIGYSCLQKRYIKHYATKWYKCNVCGCLWEFQYPDFPANGHVRKIWLNNYTQIPYKWDCMII